MLTLDNVSVNYGAIEALTGISLHVEKGEVVTLIGANGAGKTTTLRTITGLLEPRSGKITFEGEDINGKPTHKLVARGISMSPEGRGVFANLSVRENLQMGAYLNKNRRAVADNMARVFKMFSRLKERESQKAGTLSGGEQQMLAIGRALMSSPRRVMSSVVAALIKTATLPAPPIPADAPSQEMVTAKLMVTGPKSPASS